MKSNKHVHEVIPVGADNRITSREITDSYSIDGSVIRDQVNNLRSQMVPVCSDKRGYFIATKPEDLDHTIAQLSSRINNIMRARDGLLKAQAYMKSTSRSAT